MNIHNKEIKTVKTFTWNNAGDYEWMLNAGKHSIDKHMASIGPAFFNSSRKEIEDLAKRWMKIYHPNWNANTRKVKASCAFYFMVDGNNLIETGSKVATKH